MTKALLHGDMGRRRFLLALTIIAILLAVALVTRPSSAQTAESPNWWRLMSENMVCAPLVPKDRFGNCTIGPFQMTARAKYPTSGSVRLSDQPAGSPPDGWSLLQPGKKLREIRVEFRAMPDTDERTLDRSVNLFNLAGFGLESSESGQCPASRQVVADVLQRLNIAHRGGIVIDVCNWDYSSDTGLSYIRIAFTTEFGGNAPPPPPGNCNTDLLKGPWRAESPALAKTGHAVTFAAAPNAPKHDAGQVAQRGAFSTYPAHKNLLQLLPNPLFTAGRAFEAGKDQCLIPVVSQRDSGTSRSAVLIDTKASTLRFVTERAYRWESNGYRLNAVEANMVGGMEGRWLRGAAPALAATCSPADFNGRWDRSDGAKITIRGAGTDGVGGYASMDENPGDWVRGQNKYVSMRMKSACVYTAKCYASQRTSTNGRPDFKMVESACELVIDPASKRMTERGTSNTYVYTKAGAGAAARQPPSAVTPPEPAPPSQAVQSLNSEQAAAAKRESQAYEARKKAIADEQAAKVRAYQQALADHRAKVAEIERKAREDLAKWRADAAACQAGDLTKCAPSPQ